MTKMASYEENEGKKSTDIGTYFKGDYISKEIIKSIIYGTVAFLVIFAMYVAYDIEYFMQDIYKMDLWEFAKTILIDYVKFIVVYSAITYVVYAMRYQKARYSLRMYYNNLRRLSFMYRKERKTEDK